MNTYEFINAFKVGDKITCDDWYHGSIISAIGKARFLAIDTETGVESAHDMDDEEWFLVI